MTIGLAPRDKADRAAGYYQAGDYPAAIRAFADAASAYLEIGDPVMSAEMKNNQSVAFLRDRQPQAALDAARGTELVFAGAGDSRRQGMALANQASALDALKLSGEAIGYYIQAGDALEKAGEVEYRLEVMQLLSSLYLRRFKFLDAILALQSGLAAIKNPSLRQRVMKKLLFIRL